MFTNVFKKFSPANFVFAVYFKEGVDRKSVQESINFYLSMYSQFRMTGTRETDPEDSMLGWNLMGLKMSPDFNVDNFLHVLSTTLHGVDGVAATIVEGDSTRKYFSAGLSDLRKSALELQCLGLTFQGNDPNHSLSIN